MKLIKVVFGAALALAFGNAYAFHEGGVAYCDGCHTMHASEGGKVMQRSNSGRNSTGNLTQFQAGPYLLQGTTQSEACLNCHEGSPGSYHISDGGFASSSGAVVTTAPQNITPGGNFSWLKLSYTWTSPRAGSEDGSRHGHSIVAPAYGYSAETKITGNVGPGGQYSVNNLQCSSCHDPHGKYRQTAIGTFSTSGAIIAESGSYGATPSGTAADGTPLAVGAYRLLGGSGYAPKSYTNFPFGNNPPIAIAPDTYNRAETAAAQTRVAHISGMSEWCSNCHANIHNNNATPVAGSMRHPTGNAAKLNTFADNYNAYVRTGNLSGLPASSFLSLVQFEEGQGTFAAAAAATHANIDGSYLAGPATTANVTCLSCHRAHATGFQSMTRWEMKSEFLTVAGALNSAGNITTAYPDMAGDINSQEGVEARGKNANVYQAAMNGIEAAAFSPFQRSLCNKCHVKD